MDHAVELLLGCLSISCFGISLLLLLLFGGVEVNLKKNADSVYIYKTTFYPKIVGVSQII